MDNSQSMALVMSALNDFELNTVEGAGSGSQAGSSCVSCTTCATCAGCGCGGCGGCGCGA